MNHAGGCCSCALLCLAGGCRWEDCPVEGSQAGDLQTEQVMSKGVSDVAKGKHWNARFLLPQRGVLKYVFYANVLNG